MGEILGLGTTDYPRMRTADPNMPGPFRDNLGGIHVKPAATNPANWPEDMQKEWSDDEALVTGQIARERQGGLYSKLNDELDAFNPDFVLIWSKDQRESLKNFSVPQFWVQAYDTVDIKPGLTFFKDQDPDRVVTLKGHKEGALHLVKGLQQEGFDPTYALEPLHPQGLAHTFRGVTTHLSWNKLDYKYPIVPVSIDPFGLRERGPDGLEPNFDTAVMPMSTNRAFELGWATARVLKASPYRVALVAGVGWSHANNTSWERSWVNPDVAADQKLHDEEWATGKFTEWANRFTFEEMEEHAWWELICWVALAGAMTELGAKLKWTDFETHYVFNSNWCNCAFTTA